MSAKAEFKYINPELYRHPEERAAKKRLEMAPGFGKALEMLAGGSGGKAERQAETASMIRVGPGVYPALNDLWIGVLDLFGLKAVPLFIAYKYPQLWAVRGGNDDPALILDGSALDTLSEAQMEALLAAQAGSIRLGNATYLGAADFLRRLSDFSGLIGAPAAMVSWGLENWRRWAMYSGDRAASLALGDPEATASLLATFAGAGRSRWGGVVQPDALRIQGIEAVSLERDWSNSRWRRFALAMNRQNHAALVRRADVLDWFESGRPARILTGQEAEPEAAKTEPAASPADEASADPSLAFWGEYASPKTQDDGEAGSCIFGRCPMMTAVGVAEKGWDAFWKAGESFWKTLRK